MVGSGRYSDFLEDVVQGAWLRLLGRIRARALRPGGIGSLLATMAKHTLLDLIKSEARQTCQRPMRPELMMAATTKGVVYQDSQGVETEDISDLGRQATSIELVVVAWDTITQALDPLTDRQYAVFVRSLGGETQASIAEDLSMSTGQVNADLKRILALLTELGQPDPDDPGGGSTRQHRPRRGSETRAAAEEARLRAALSGLVGALTRLPAFQELTGADPAYELRNLREVFAAALWSLNATNEQPTVAAAAVDADRRSTCVPTSKARCRDGKEDVTDLGRLVLITGGCGYIDRCKLADLSRPFVIIDFLDREEAARADARHRHFESAGPDVTVSTIGRVGFLTTTRPALAGWRQGVAEQGFEPGKQYFEIDFTDHLGHGKNTLAKMLASKGLASCAASDSIDQVPAEQKREAAIVLPGKHAANRLEHGGVDYRGHTVCVMRALSGAVHINRVIQVVLATGLPMVQAREDLRRVHQARAPHVASFLHRCGTENDLELLDIVAPEERELLAECYCLGDDAPTMRGSVPAPENHDVGSADVKGIIELRDTVGGLSLRERVLVCDRLMPIEDIFTISIRNTIVPGQVERGIIKVGNEIRVVRMDPTDQSLGAAISMFRKIVDYR